MGTAGEGSNYTIHLHAETYRQNFTSPGYPDAYPNNMRCTWVIEACEYCMVVLVLSTVQIQHSHGCVQDGLVLHDGSEVYDTIIETVCGNTTGRFESSGKAMRITLYTDAIGQDRGYSGYYYAEDNEFSTIAGIIAGAIIGLLFVVIVIVLIAYRVKTRRAWFCQRNPHKDAKSYACGSGDTATRDRINDSDNFLVCFCKGLCSKSVSQVVPSADEVINQGTSGNHGHVNNTISNDVPKQMVKPTDSERSNENTEANTHAKETDNQNTDNCTSGLPPMPKIRSVKKKRAPAPPIRPVNEQIQTPSKPPDTQNNSPVTPNKPSVPKRKLITDNGEAHPIQENNYMSKSAEETSELEMELVRRWSMQFSGNGDATPVKEPVKITTSGSTKSPSGSKRTDSHTHTKKTPKRKLKAGIKNLKSKLNKKKKEKISIVLYMDDGSTPSDIITEHVQFEETTTGVNLNECFKNPKQSTGAKSKGRETKKNVEADKTPRDRGHTYVQRFSNDDAVTTDADTDSDDAGVYLYRVSEVTELSETIFMYDDELPNTVPVG